MMVVTSLKSPGPCNKEIIEYDLEENNILFKPTKLNVHPVTNSKLDHMLIIVMTTHTQMCSKTNNEIKNFIVRQ